MKTIGKWLMVTMLVLGGFGAFGTGQKAEATTYVDGCYAGEGTCIERGINLRTDVNTYIKGVSSFVGVSITLDSTNSHLYNWKLSFEKNYSGVWQTYFPPTSKYGYVTRTSSSYREWSMIDFTTGEYRVVMDIQSDGTGESAAYTGNNALYVTKFWVE